MTTELDWNLGGESRSCVTMIGGEEDVGLMVHKVYTRTPGNQASGVDDRTPSGC